MIRSPPVSLGSLQHYCWLHRNFPRRNKVPGGKHFLIEIPLRKWCHSHSLEYAAQCNNNEASQSPSLTSVQLILQSIQSFVTLSTSLPKSYLSDCWSIITLLHLHSLRLNSSDWNNKHQVSEHVFIIWTLSGDPHIWGHKKYSNALSIQWNLISICHMS